MLVGAREDGGRAGGATLVAGFGGVNFVQERCCAGWCAWRQPCVVRTNSIRWCAFMTLNPLPPFITPSAGGGQHQPRRGYRARQVPQHRRPGVGAGCRNV